MPLKDYARQQTRSEPPRRSDNFKLVNKRILNAGHFALDTAADEIVALVRGFLGSQR
jgi:hypothetical protein